MIIASCGHTLTDNEDLGKMIAVKSYTREGKRAIDNLVVCDKCLRDYENNNQLVKSKTEENEWFAAGQK